MSARDYSPRRRRIAEHLERSIRRLSHADLQNECKTQGYDDLLLNKAVGRDRSSLCNAMLQRLLAPWEVNDDDPETIEAWLTCTADPWPETEPREQPDMSTAKGRAAVLDEHGPWGMSACGAEVRLCPQPEKGRGAFATRRVARGTVVGVYAGELLDQRQHALRHAERGPLFLPPDEEEAAALREREGRLAGLRAEDGAPMGGLHNHGGYAFAFLPDVHSQQFPGRCAFVDAEDPRRSSWARYVNHASDKTSACNLEPKCAAPRALVWLQARRDIEAGEELAFDYGPLFDGAEKGAANLLPP